MQEEKQRLLKEAEHCRRIADRIVDQETATRLRALAEDYETKAARLDGGNSEGSP